MSRFGLLWIFVCLLLEMKSGTHHMRYELFVETRCVRRRGERETVWGVPGSAIQTDGKVLNEFLI